jgi:hypothetical protein
MTTMRVTLLILSLLLAGCADDPRGCHQAGGTWDGVHCSVR